MRLAKNTRKLSSAFYETPIFQIDISFSSLPPLVPNLRQASKVKQERRKKKEERIRKAKNKIRNKKKEIKVVD